MGGNAPLIATLLIVLGVLFFGRYFLVRKDQEAETEATRRAHDLLASGSLGSAPTSAPDEEATKRSGIVDRLADRLASSTLLQDRDDGKNFMERLDLALIQAGLRSRYTPEKALALALTIWAVGVVMPLLFILVAELPKALVLPAVVFFALYPPLKLKQLITSRKEAIEAEVPFFINDLYMAISTGALTIDQAIVRVARTSEEDPHDSILAREFAQAHVEYTMGGKTQVEALRDVGRRTGVVSVQNLCEALVQGIRTGTEMPKILREYSNQAQEMWHQAMRTFKNRKEPLVTLGLVITMFGAFIIFATPMVIGLMKSIGGL